MDPFVVIVFGGLGLALAAVLWLGTHPPERFVSEVLNRRDNERWATQLQIESEEVPQMLEAANAYRRARGIPEVPIEHFEAKAAHTQRALIRQAERHRAAASRGAG